MTADRPALLFEIVATTRGRRVGDRRSAVFWTGRSIVVCPSISTKVAEAVEIEVKKLSAPHAVAIGASPPPGERPPEDLAGWILHHQPDAEIVEIPLADLVLVEWPGRRAIVVQTREKTWRIPCESAWEAGREFRLLREEGDRLLREETLPPRGLPRGTLGFLLGAALIAAPLLYDLSALVEAVPGTQNPDAVRDFFIDLQAPAIVPWVYRGCLVLGALLAIISLWRLAFRQRVDVLLPYDSSTPMTVNYVPNSRR